MKKNDLYVIVFLTILSLSVLLFNLFSKKIGNMVVIYVNNTVYSRLPLTKNTTVNINDTNVLKIENGKAFMISANCPDHTCMKQAPLNSSERDIVCLPNRVVVKVENAEKNSIDILAR